MRLRMLTPIGRHIQVMSFVILAGCSSAFADDLTSFQNRIELESNSDATTFQTYYAEGSITASLAAPFWESGPKLKVTGSESFYHYLADPSALAQSRGRDTELDALIGYGFALEPIYIAAFVGPTELFSKQFSANGDPSTETVKRGVKVLGQLYANPTENTMVFSQASYTTINNGFFVQTKVGKAILPNVFVGPELSMSDGPTFHQVRVGLFAAGLTLGSVLVGLSAGYVQDRNFGDGAYTGLSLRAAF
jgi:hypothetical protein